MRKLAIWGTVLLAGVLAAQAADQPKKHIRVVLDASQSLRKNDPSGYVKLATALFYDLAWQTLDQQDTFKIVRFDPKWGKATTPPMSLGEPFVEHGRDKSAREQLIKQILTLSYDDPMTYFYPCLKWAYDDLQKEGTSDSNKVIVLVTDGLPEREAQAEELRLLKDLAKELHANNVHLYILAFGKEVNDNAGWFPDAFRFNASDGVTGALFAGPDVSNLLPNMLEIFSRSFGYSQQTFSEVPSSIVINDKGSVRRAAVVALYSQAGLPGFELTSPSHSRQPDAVYNAAGSADPHAQGATQAVSYAYQWLVPPEEGSYTFHSSSIAPSQVAVLRPIDIDIDVKPYATFPTQYVMAGKPAPMNVVIPLAQGGKGDPGADLRVQFLLHYCSQTNTRNASVYAAAKEEGELTREGRVFTIYPQFDNLPPGTCEGTHDENSYPGYIEIQVTRNGTVISRLQTRMHPVQVYPYLAIQPTPNEKTLTRGGHETINSEQSGCATITFQNTAGKLYGSQYYLGVRLDPWDPSGALRGAKARFDGKLLQSATGNGHDWQLTIPQKPGELIGQHEVCVDVGHPLTGADKQSLKAIFGLWQSPGDPYEKLKVIEDLSLSLSIAKPDFWQTWGAWLMLLLSLLLLYLLALLFRAKLTLAPDLAVALSEGAGPVTPARLGAPSLLERWLGIGGSRPVISHAGDKEVGTLRPLGEDLYEFRTNSGSGALSEEIDGEWRALSPTENGAWTVAAGKLYRQGAGADARLIRIDYSKDRPRV